MSTEAWVLAILAAAGVVLTGILVAYTPFRRDAVRLQMDVGHRIAVIVDAVSRWVTQLVRGRRTFWTLLLILVAGWAGVLFVRGDSFLTTRPSNFTIGTLVVGAIASVGALAVAFRRPSAYVGATSAWTYPVVRTDSKTYVVGPAPEHTLIQVSGESEKRGAKQVDLMRQTYAFAATMLKYLRPDSTGGWTRGDQVTALNGLLDKLKAEGLDLSHFAIPYNWIEVPFKPDNYAEYFSDELLAPRVEGLIVYLKRELESMPPT